MKHVILVCSLILLLFSCEKAEEKKQCWECIDKYGVELIDRFETCDILVVTKENGHRWKDKDGVWHLIICTEK
jgi:hypothetical protein